MASIGYWEYSILIRQARTSPGPRGVCVWIQGRMWHFQGGGKEAWQPPNRSLWADPIASAWLREIWEENRSYGCGGATKAPWADLSLHDLAHFIPTFPLSSINHAGLLEHHIPGAQGELICVGTNSTLQTRLNSTPAKFGMAGDPRAAISEQNVLMEGLNPSHSWEFKHSKVLGPEFLNQPNPWLVTNNPDLTHTTLSKAFPDEKFPSDIPWLLVAIPRELYSCPKEWICAWILLKSRMSPLQITGLG